MGNFKNLAFPASASHTWASNTLWDFTERFTVMMFRKNGSSSSNWGDWTMFTKGTYFTIGHAAGSHHLHRFDVNGTDYTSASNFGLPITSWHAYTATWDKDLDSGKLQQFYNDTEMGGTAKFRTTATSTNTTDLVLQGYANASKYAHVRMWNRKLSADERLSEIRSPGSIRRGLVFWARCVGGDGDRDLITGAAPTVGGTVSVEEDLNIAYRYHFPGLWLPGKAGAAPASGQAPRSIHQYRQRRVLV